MAHKPPFSGTVTGECLRYSWDGSIEDVRGLSSREVGTWSSVRSVPWPRPKGSPPPNNPFSYTYDSENVSYGEFGGYTAWAGRWTGFKGKVNGSISGYSNDFPKVGLELSELATKARGSVLDKLQGQSINLLQTFAEREQTVRMISRTVNRVASAAVAIRRGKLTHAANVLGIRGTRANVFKDIKPSPKNLANHWLEYSYGWRPLLKDIHGAAELIAKSVLRNRPYVVRSTQVDEQSGKFDFFISPQYHGYCVEVMAYMRVRKYRVVVAYAMDNDLAALASQTGISNPASLAWEILPYSFVVDWFVPVGDYLRRLDATRGLSFRWGSEMGREDLSATTIWDNRGDTDGVTVSGANRFILKQSKGRSPLLSFPINEPPSWRPSLGVSQVLSGLALLTQAFKR